MKIDAHCHTNCSDGSYTIEERIALIKQKGFDAATITDHDFVSKDQVNIARKAAGEMPFITGIELFVSCNENQAAHLLGYFIEPENEELQSYLAEAQLNSKNCVQKMIEAGRKDGIEFDVDDLKASSLHTFYMIHFLKRIANDLFKDNVNDLFPYYSRLWERAGLSVADMYPLHIKDGIELVHNAGGIAVLAHPGVTNSSDIGLFCHTEKEIKQYKDWGLDGLEIYHPVHTDEQVDEYRDMAKKYNLLCTAGSDCHGELPILSGLGVTSNLMDTYIDNVPNDMGDLYERMVEVHECRLKQKNI
jgi:predicted metal-dependent phosphoesterase TrpH